MEEGKSGLNVHRIIEAMKCESFFSYIAYSMCRLADRSVGAKSDSRLGRKLEIRRSWRIRKRSTRSRLKSSVLVSLRT